MKKRIDDLDFIKIKNFCSAKDSVKRMRRKATDLKKTFATDVCDMRLLSKINKEHQNLIENNLIFFNGQRP